MKCQGLFSEKKKKKDIISLSSAEFFQRVIKVKRHTFQIPMLMNTYRSGDEGYYPQLQQICEDRLRELNPNRFVHLY